MGEIQRATLEYASDHDGEYPDQLSEVEDRYFPNGLPADPFTREPYHYERTKSGFRLVWYGKDGEPGGLDPPDEDIIFTEKGQQEATGAE